MGTVALIVTAPIWLAGRSHHAGLSRSRARIVLLLLALAAAALLVPAARSGADRPVGDAAADAGLYAGVVAAMRQGGEYYAVTARELRSRPGLPLRPFTAFRLPTLARVQAALPPVLSLALLFGIAAAAMLAWSRRIGEALPRAPARIAGALLLAGGIVMAVQPALHVSHEAWAGLLVAWSIALRRPGRWVEAAALATMAMLVRETAALYAIVMAGLAWRERYRREALGWAAGLAVLAAALAAHGWAVAQVTGPLDPPAGGWAGPNGLGLYVAAIRHATVLGRLPHAVAAPLIVLALFGWTAWRDPLATRMAATLLAYALLIGGAAGADDLDWGLMIAPACLVGLAFAPDGLRDLVRASLDRRRYTVTRTRA